MLPFFIYLRIIFQGPDLVVAAAARRENEEPKAHFIPASAKSAGMVEWSEGDGKACCRAKNVYLK